MSKKILSLFLAVIAAVTLFASCGKGKSDSTSAPTTEIPIQNDETTEPVKTSYVTEALTTPPLTTRNETTIPAVTTKATARTTTAPIPSTTTNTPPVVAENNFFFRTMEFPSTEISVSKLHILDYYADYSFSDFIENGGAANNAELIKYLITAYPNAKVNISSLGYGCSAYFTDSSDGDFIYGRNFDMSSEMTGAYLMVHTKPKDGYESYSMVNLGFIGLHKITVSDEDVKKELKSGISPLLLAPYIPLDGINENGVAISVLQLDYPEVHEQDKTAANLTPTTMIRYILDHAFSLDDAVCFFNTYNMNTDGYSYHFLVSDSSGASAVIEYVNGKTVVTYKSEDEKVQTAANEFVSEEGRNVYGVNDGGDSDRRTSSMKKDLENSGYDLSKIENSFSPLDAAKQSSTRWSVVYNLTKRTINIAINGNFGTICEIQNAFSEN